MNNYFDGDAHYAWTQLMATSTFLALIFVDTLAHMVDQRKKMLMLIERGPRHVNCPSTCTTAENSLASSVSTFTTIADNPVYCDTQNTTSDHQTTQASTPVPTESNGDPTPLNTRTASFTYGARDYDENSAKYIRKIGSLNDIASMYRPDLGLMTGGLMPKIADENRREEKPLLKGRKRKRHQSAKMSCLIFIGALSFHSVLEGIGIGAADDEQSFYGILSAIMAHKFIEAFVAGLLIKKAGFSYAQESLLALIYAVMTPTGVIVSMLLGAFLDSYPLVPAIFLSCGCGSFMFVGFWEMLNQSLDTKKVEKNLFLGKGIYWEVSKRFLWIFVGFATMASFAVID